MSSVIEKFKKSFKNYKNQEFSRYRKGDWSFQAERTVCTKAKIV